MIFYYINSIPLTLLTFSCWFFQISRKTCFYLKFQIFLRKPPNFSYFHRSESESCCWDILFPSLLKMMLKCLLNNADDNPPHQSPVNNYVWYWVIIFHLFYIQSTVSAACKYRKCVFYKLFLNNFKLADRKIISSVW